MGNKTKRTPTEKLRLIGAWQLGTYLFILVWLVVFESLYVIDSGRDFFGAEGGFPWMWVPFVLLGSLLVPSAVEFIQTGRNSQKNSTKSSRTLQTVLFVLVLLLTLPAYALFSMLWMHGVIISVFSILLLPCYFVACVLGIVSFPIMWKTTKTLIPKTIRVSADEYQNLIKQ
jgi:hypothetical protein